ncbi:MAG: gliding motility lipoprotein GldH [Bacteroidales bacterium]|nr:gliding motility lipoprotein GldH [Bacteroidales bacterium]
MTKRGLFAKLIAVAACVALVACDNVVYTDCRDVGSGWSKDSVLTFPLTIDDPHGLYQTQIVVRNTDTYRNQNLWLFVDTETPAGTHRCDTVQFFLADEFGRWVGSGVGTIFENVWIYQPRVRYSEAGTYTLRVQHGMRYDTLDGIGEVGVRVLRID